AAGSGQVPRCACGRIDRPPAINHRGQLHHRRRSLLAMRGALILAAVAAGLALAAGTGARAQQTPPPRLVVRTLLDPAGPLYIEGALSFVAVDKPSGENVVTKQVNKRLVLHL